MSNFAKVQVVKFTPPKMVAKFTTDESKVDKPRPPGYEYDSARSEVGVAESVNAVMIPISNITITNNIYIY